MSGYFLIRPMVLAVLACWFLTPESLAQELVPVSSRREIGWSHSPDQLPQPARRPQQEFELPAQAQTAPDYVGGPARAADTITQRYSDGKPQVTRQVMQDQQGNFLNHGAWKLFSPRGEVMAEGFFKEGLMDGTWQRWHPANSEGLFGEAPFNQYRGPFLSIATFSQGKLDGSWSIFDRDRRKIFEMPYIDGKRNGRALWYFPNSLPMREVDFKEGQLHGQLIEYNRENKKTRESIFDESQEIISRKEFYFKDQKRFEHFYLGPKMEFVEEDDWWNARPASYESNGEELQHGTTREWYANGQLRLAGQYQEGLQVGSFMWWHENGQKQIEGQFSRGMKKGHWSWFHANGRKAIEGEYANNVEIGHWTWWTEDGEVEDQRDFSLETLEGIETIDSSGSEEEADEFPDLSIDSDT